MTLRHLKIFVAVCKQGGVTAAAEKLYLAQPSVSLAISELEEYYGIKLFDRISRKLEITDAGKQFYDYAVHIVSLFDRLEQEIKNWDSVGTLRVGSSITVGTTMLPTLLAAFKTGHAEARVEVKIDNSAVIEKAVLTNAVDIAFIEGRPHSEKVTATLYFGDRLVVVCAPDHPLAKHESVTLEEIGGQALLLREPGSGVREVVDYAMRSKDLAFSPLMESASTLAILNCVEQGLGVSVLPPSLAQDAIRHGRVVSVPVSDADLERQFYLIHHHNKYLSKLAKDFIALATEQPLPPH